MAKAVGIGGIFFRASDPVALAAWYAENFGLPEQWQTEAGMTVFAPFPAASDYFPANRQFMINFRVDDLDGLIARLNAGGIAVETREEWDMPGVGRFARVVDPEGNHVELWEPEAPAAT